MPRATEIPQPLRRRPFTLAQARTYGLSDDVLYGARFRRMFDGVYVCDDVQLGLSEWLEAAFLITPADSVATGLTGLRARGIDVGPRWPLHLATASGVHLRRDRLRLSRVRKLPAHEGRLGSAEHCFVVACAHLDLVDAVTIGDWLLHLGHCPQALADYVAAYSGTGRARARRAMALIRERVESPRESYVRLMLVLAGLPEPKCNPNLGDDAGFIGRGDLAYLAYRVIVEYDGRLHVEVEENWEYDLDRLDDFADTSWLHYRVTARRLRRPRAVVTRVYERLRARGYAGPPPVFGDEWVHLFERTTAADRARTSLGGPWDA